MSKLKTPIALKSDEYQAIYFLVTKCGSMSIRNALFGTKWDVEPYKVSMSDAWQQYRDYRWISFVRHPLSRSVSLFYFMNQKYTRPGVGQWKDQICEKHQIERDMGIYVFLDQLATLRDERGLDMHFRSQDSMIPDNNMFFIGRMENMEEDWNRLDLPPLPHRNVTEHKPWQSYFYDGFGNKLPIAYRLEERFRIDLNRFDYERLPDYADPSQHRFDE